MLTYAYDNLNRVIRKIVPERAGLAAVHTRDVYYDYNHALGLQTKALFDALDGFGVTSYYDQFGQPTTVLLNMDGNVRYTSYYHDDSGKLARLTHPDGVHIGYGYDALGRLTTVLDNPAFTSIDDIVIRYWYKPEGRTHAAVRGAGAVGFTTVFYYDPLNRPIAIYNDLPVAGADVNIGLSYNHASQIAERSRDNDSYAWTGHYNVSRGYSVNGLNQYTAAGPASFTYDPNGNLTSDGTMSFTYDVENRLVSASNGANLVYDPLGRLFQTSGGAAGTTQFLYDGDKLIAEYNGSGTLLRRYVHGQGVDEPVAGYDGAALGVAGRRYTLPDERGSVIGLVNANGTPSVINSYDSWGIPGAGNGGRFQYTGQAWIPELGMYHYKARIYSPTLGRFLQTDPVGYDDQINLYAYVGNDPMNAVDPRGEATDKPEAPVTCGSRVGISASCNGETVLALAGAIEGGQKSRDTKGPRARREEEANRQMANYLRSAVIDAIERRCRCEIDESNLIALNPNMVRIVDPSRLPAIFRGSVSIHAGARSASIPGSDYIVKLYTSDSSSQCGGNCATITTPLSSLSHWVMVPFYLMGDPVNSYNARQYCLQVGCRFQD